MTEDQARERIAHLQDLAREQEAAGRPVDASALRSRARTIRLLWDL